MKTPNHNYPKTLYKYRSWSNNYHRKILTDNELYLASPSDFNDPFDCRIPNNYGLLDNDEKIIEYVEGVIRRQYNAIVTRGYNPEDEKNRMINDLKSNLEGVQSRDNAFVFSMQDKHFGVLSLSARYDSILMWSHYGDFHKGFCLGFNEEKLRLSGLFGKGGMVSYTEEFPEIDPRDTRKMEKSFIQTHNKAKDWFYEEEYRLTKLFFPDEPSNKDRIVVFPDDFIEEVILGIKINNHHKEQIIELARSKGIPVYQGIQVPFEFKINKTLI